MKNKAILYCENNEKIEILAQFLIKSNWQILSAGETARFLTSKNIPVTECPFLENSFLETTSFVKILKEIFVAGKTVYQYEESDSISLVCTNFNVADKPVQEMFDSYFYKKEIDLVRQSLLNVAIKNYKSVLVLTDPIDYNDAMLRLSTENIKEDFRLYLVSKALNLSSAYSAAASDTIMLCTKKHTFPNFFMLPYQFAKRLKHGINKQQVASLYSINCFNSALNGLKKIQGSEMSFNAIINVNTVCKTISDFVHLIKFPFSVPSENFEGYPYTTQFSPMAGNVFTVGVKNSTIISASLAPNVTESILKTYKCSPESFQHAVIGSSAVIDEEAAKIIKDLNIRTIVAPDFTKEAKEFLAENKNLQMIIASNPTISNFETISVDGGLLVQTTDSKLFEKWKIVTTKRPDQDQIDEMAFGMMLSLSSKSYSSIILKNHATTGFATGQTIPSKAVLYSLYDSKEFSNNNENNAEVLVCDSAINFDERLKCIADYGIKAIIQTGGTQSDEAFINYCNEKGICMVFTGIKHLTY